MCSSCGDLPDVVVCDDTMLGFRKDLLPVILCKPDVKSLPTIHGSKHSDRVFLKSVQGRKLLLQYSGYNKDRRKPKILNPLTPTEFKMMIDIVNKDSLSLATIIASLSEITPYNSPALYAELFAELSYNSPVCGIFQHCNHKEVLEILKCIQNDQMDLLDSSNHHQLRILQQYVPILASFLSKCYTENNGHIPFLV